jgi:hypothetical protein
MSRTDPWPDADIAKLRELAATGMRTAAIGAHMGRTKNSIVGKMLRLGIGYGHPPGWGETKVTVLKINGTGGVALGNMMANIRGARPDRSCPTSSCHSGIDCRAHGRHLPLAALGRRYPATSKALLRRQQHRRIAVLRLPLRPRLRWH